MTRPPTKRTATPSETPAATIARLEQECAQLRWERDLLAAQATDVSRLWLQLTETAAECDTLRAEVTRLTTARQGPSRVPDSSGTDQLAWVTMAVGGRVPNLLEGLFRD